VSDDGGDVRVLAHVRGTVQGVGFRWWTRARCLELGLVGTARNLPDGRVEVDAQGPRPACDALVALLRAPDGDASARRPGSVTGVAVQELPARPGTEGFREV